MSIVPQNLIRREMLAAMIARLTKRTELGPPRALLAEALSTNPHVPEFLLRYKEMPVCTPDDVGFGDEREAIAFCADYASVWSRTPGAIEWLRTRGA